MKFKGHILKLNGQDFTLKDQLSEGGFSLIYSTNKPQAVCKVQMISNANIAYAYQNQKEALSHLTHKNIVKCYGTKQQKIGDNNVGFMVLQNCCRGNAFDILEKSEGSVPEATVLSVMHAVACALEYMHAKGYSHRDIKLENVLLNTKNEFKLCDFGSSTKQVIHTINKQNRAEIQEHIEKTTTPIYRCPQQLDMYSGYPIGPKVDVFALGVLGFIMSFKKQPFQTRLSAINNQYFLPDEHIYSKEFIQIIQDCFTCDPRDRPSARIIKQRIINLIKRKKAHIEINYNREFDATNDQLSHINSNIFKQTSVAEVGFLSKVKRIYTQITTQTQGWIMSFIQDSEQAPNLKFNRSIISKCWEKRYKVDKFYNLIWRSSEQCKNKSLVTLKLLTLLHNFLRKGPKEALTYSDKDCAIKICQKIYMHWKCSERPTDPEDIKRNSFVVLLIRMYCIIIIGKCRLCYENSDLIEGNYSILPYFTSKEELTILKLPFIEQMISFLENCASFHEELQRNNYLIDIQRTILLSMVDEEYCLVSTLVFIISAFKQAVNYVDEQLDLQKLSKKIKIIEVDFKDIYQRLILLFKKNSKLASLFEHNQFELNPKVIDYIQNIQICNQHKRKNEQFQVSKFLNYKTSIHGLKIPLTYQQVVKNPQFLKDVQNHKVKSKEYIEINQYKAKNKKVQTKNSPQSISKQYQTPSFQHAQSLKQEQQKKNMQSVYSNFSSFTLQMAPSSPKNPISDKDKQIFNTMEFTHQNLNVDFQSKNDEQVKTTKKEDKFADFMSIVEQKYNDDKKATQQTDMKKNSNDKPFSKEKKQKIIQRKQNQQKKSNTGTDFDMISKEVRESVRQPEQKNPQKSQQPTKIKKIQLINFFDDDEDEKPEVTQSEKKTKTTNLDIDLKVSDLKNNEDIVMIPNIKQQEQLLKTDKKKIELQLNSINQMGYLSKRKQEPKQQIQPQKVQKQVNQTEKDRKIKRQEERIEKEKKQMVNKIKEVNIIDENNGLSKTADSFIDLKEFIVEEVKKNAEQYFIDYGALRFKKKIGFGHSSEVFKGEWRGREVAIKKIKDDISSPNAEKQFRRQIMTSVRIRHHPQLVTLIGVAQHDNFYYIINEYCQGATLFDILHESKVPLPWKTRISIAKQIASGMLFLHTNQPPIIHRDLKSLNVLLVNKYSDKHPDSMQIKIADFGLSRDFASTYMTGILGTYHWMAPEIFNNEQYSLNADVYSFAIVLWEIAARKPPYLNMKNPQALMKFVTIQNGRPDFKELPQDCPPELIKLMIQCWDRSPSNRPNFQEILDHLRRIEFF